MTPSFAAPDPRAVRPGRGWYAVAAAIVVLGVLAGVGLFAFGVVSLVRGLPKMTSEFAAGTPATVQFTPGRKSAIYVEDPTNGSSGGPSAECTGTAQGDGSINLVRTSEHFDFTKGRRHWHFLYTVEVTRAGAYTLTCQTSGEGSEFGVGDAPDVGGFIAGIFGGIAALIGLPCLALVVGGIIALVTGLRRSSARKRLQQQQIYGYPPG